MLLVLEPHFENNLFSLVRLLYQIVGTTVEKHHKLGAQTADSGLDGKEFACNAGDLGLISGSGRSPGKGNGRPHQYSCLENSMDGSLVGYSP